MGNEIRRGRQDRLGHRLTGSSDYAEALARNRALTVAALAALIAAAWGYTVHLALGADSAGMQSMMQAAAAPAAMTWQLADFTFMLAMWGIMSRMSWPIRLPLFLAGMLFMVMIMIISRFPLNFAVDVSLLSVFECRAYECVSGRVGVWTSVGKESGRVCEWTCGRAKD